MTAGERLPSSRSKSGRRNRQTHDDSPASGLSGVLAGPMSIWIVLFFMAPAGIMILYSFWQVEAFQIVRNVSLDNYIRVLTTDFYRQALVSSFIVGIATAVICCVLAFGLAWSIRFHTSKYRDLLVMLILVASMGSYLARIFSWRSVLGTGGLINSVLASARLIDAPLEGLLFNRGAVVVALVHLFLPFAFLPIYASLLTVPVNTLQASRVLGAGPFQTLARVGLPMSSTGLAISFLYVLIFSTADFAAPTFLGGSQGVVAAQLIADQFGATFNWPLGSALAVVYVLILGLLVGAVAWYAVRMTKRLQT